MENPTYIVNFVEKPLKEAGYFLQYQLNGLTRYVRGKYEVNIMLDVNAPFRLYLVRRIDDSKVYKIMSTYEFCGEYIYENAPVNEFIEIATKPNSDILQAVSNRVIEKTLNILE